ncbi:MULTISPECIES: RHS repeat-associated core domain-containing protein [unclassified Pseudomonas]|uniref:RHS repeat-associated core domain-containing protein n=1 Tax=unclassified Pseudomonas TaxID=196821 RepID=UPI0009E97771|nr:MULTISPECIES: RHS repeat-associated core domain-containing protein [unclassified Pseudomonas]
MLPNRETLLCRYHYDPLDRLVDCTPSTQAPTRRFYLKDRLATEIQDAVQRSIMQHEDQLLAQQQRQSGAMEAHLLATDQQRSVLNVLDVARPHSMAYTPYGHRPVENGLLSLLGFNGERPDPVTGCYLLGNGYRAFNPVLMRFNSPDSWSPFGEGGLNAYAYCMGDPTNRAEVDGHWSVKGAFKSIFRSIGLRSSSRAAKPVIQNGPIENVRVLSDGVVRFDTVYEGKKQLNIEAHGIKATILNKSSIASNRNPLDPKQLFEQLKHSEVNITDYGNIHLIACHAGSNGGSSFAGRLAKITETPVDAYRGQVRISRSRSPLREHESRKSTNEVATSLDMVFKGKNFARNLSDIGTAIRYTP